MAEGVKDIPRSVEAMFPLGYRLVVYLVLWGALFSADLMTAQDADPFMAAILSILLVRLVVKLWLIISYGVDRAFAIPMNAPSGPTPEHPAPPLSLNRIIAPVYYAAVQIILFGTIIVLRSDMIAEPHGLINLLTPALFQAFVIPWALLRIYARWKFGASARGLCWR